MAQRGYFFRRLLFGALAAGLPVVVLAGFLLLRSVREAEDAALRSVVAHSSEVARRVEVAMTRLEAVADFLLSRAEVRAMDGERCGLLLREFVRVDALVANVGVFDLQGRPLCVARPLPVPTPDFANSRWYRQARAAEGRVLTQPYFSPATQRQVLTLASPVRDDDGRRVGVLGLSVDLERMSNQLLPTTNTPPGGATSVVAADGTLIARYPDPRDWIGKPSPLLQQLPAPSAGGHFDGTGVDGVDRRIAYSAPTVHGWRVFSGVPGAYFAALRREHLNRGLAMLALALAAGAGVALWGARRLSRPWLGLIDTARRLAAGDESARADDHAPGEVGQLGAEFNRMVGRLVDSRDEERAANARFLRVFQALPVPAVVLAQGSGELLEINEAFCAAYAVTRDRALGQELTALGLGLAEADRDAFWQRLRRDGRVRDFETRIRVRPDVWRDVLVAGEPIDFAGRPAVLAVQIDVTDRNAAEAAMRRQETLQAANQAKTEFLSRMSHELRTPLSAVLGLSKLLRTSTEGRLRPDEARQLELLSAAGEQLRALIDDVLDVSRIEAGRLAVAMQPLDLVTLLDDALRLSEGAARETGVRLARTPVDAPPLLVASDPVRLRQVVLNLISNAIKYNRPGGRVAVHVESGWGLAVVTFADNGIGMSPQQLDKLFQPFNRLGREHGRVQGTGIGLVLTRDLVGLLGGRLTVDSVEGAGTTVQLELPLLDAELPVVPEPEDAPPPAAAAAPAGRVLYVEDNPVNAMIVEQLLAAWPSIDLRIAETGGEGLRLARDWQPDLILLDMQLPDTTGLRMIAALRAGETTAATPIVALSANAMAGDVQEARAAGADDYWTKPIDFDPFRDGIRAWLAPRRTATPAEAPPPPG